MTYPLSSDVVAGQPTAADHYNNLRADALRLGQAAVDSNNLGDMLFRYEQSITIQMLGTDRLRVPCTVTVPVALVVDNYFILRSTNNVDLPIIGKPSGSAAMWYLFAVRTPGSTVFTLQVNTSPVESSGLRLIGSFYWNGTAIEPASIRTSKASDIATSINSSQYVGCNGRLSMYSAGAGFQDYLQAPQVFLVPYKGNQISLFVPGWGWNNHPLPTTNPPSISFSGLNTARLYDVFAYWDGSNVQIENLAWSNLTARATSIVQQDGVYLKSTDLSRLYIGTFLPNSASAVSDTAAERGLWNYFNRVARPLLATVATASWTYNVPGTWRSPNGSDVMAKAVFGLGEDTAFLQVTAPCMANASLYGMVGVGDNANNANSADIIAHNGGTITRSIVQATYNHIPVVGAHNFYWIENTNGSGNVTFYGNPIAGQSQAGLTGIIQC